MVMLLPKIVAQHNLQGDKTTENPTQKPQKTKLAIFIITILIVSTLAAGIGGYYIAHSNASTNNQQNQTPTAVNEQSSTTSSTTQTDETLPANASLSQIYQLVSPSVVVVEDFQPETDLFNQVYYSQVQGSGFVYDLNSQEIIVTNYHVIDGGVNITITFQDGNTYPGTVLGSDPYSDLGSTFN